MKGALNQHLANSYTREHRATTKLAVSRVVLEACSYEVLPLGPRLPWLRRTRVRVVHQHDGCVVLTAHLYNTSSSS